MQPKLPASSAVQHVAGAVNGRSERVLLATASQMAQQYYNTGNYSMARKLLDSMSVSYRHESWRSLLTTILLTACDCAVRLNDDIGVVNYSLELMGMNLLCTNQQKVLLMQQIYKLVSNAVQAGPQPSPMTAPNLFDTVFEVDRRHSLLHASSHFLVQPVVSSITSPSISVTSAPAHSSKDVSVCVGEEFDLVLCIGAGFPVATTFQRMDVYFYCPALASSNTTPTAPATPYHLVLLPGGASVPVIVPEHGALSSGLQDATLPILRPDARTKEVFTDLSFPAVLPTTNSSATVLATPKPGAQGFTFGASAIHASSAALPASTTRLGMKHFRIRMRATTATSLTSTPVGADANLATATQQTMFPTSLVVALNVPANPAAPATTTRLPSLQFRTDILPSKSYLLDDRVTPVSVLEARRATRLEQEKIAKRKGRTLEPEVDERASPDRLIRAPTLRIFPPHARARVELVHPAIGLVGEYMPLTLKVTSEGDELRDTEVVLHSNQIGGATIPVAAPTAAAPVIVEEPATPLGASSSDGLMRSGSSGGGFVDSTTGGGANTTNPMNDQPRFYRLANPDRKQNEEPVFEEIASGIVTFPNVAALATASNMIFIRVLTPSTPVFTMTLSYTNGSVGASKSSSTPQKLSITHALSTLAFKQPFKIKTKIFSDALSGMTTLNGVGSANGAPGAAAPGVNPSSIPQRLIVNAPGVIHIEFENNSGVCLSIHELLLELSTKFFSNSVVTNRPLRTCASPAAKKMMKDVESAVGLTSSSATSSPSSQPPTILLAPGEKYTHLFPFLSVLAGKTRYTPLHIKWQRVVPWFESGATPVNGTSVNAVVAQNASTSSPTSPSTSSSPRFFPTPLVHTRKDLSSFHILRTPLTITFVHPPSCVFGETFVWTITIKNETEQMHDVEIGILGAGEDGNTGSGPAASAGGAVSSIPNSSSASAGVAASSSPSSHPSSKMIFSGRTKGLLRIRPQSSETLKYIICPLECGMLQMPKIQLKAAGLTQNVGGGVTNSVNSSPPSSTLNSTATPSPQQQQQQQSILLVDPNDTGSIFVQPKAKILNGNESLSQQQHNVTIPSALTAK